jgi:hypothetical protein
MNKKELVEAIAAKTAQAALPPTAVNAPVEISFESLKKGESLVLPWLWNVRSTGASGQIMS